MTAPATAPEATPPAAPARHRRLVTAVLIAIALAVVVLLSLWPVPQAHAQTRNGLLDQQKIADTFFALKLIPNAIWLSDAVVLSQP